MYNFKEYLLTDQETVFIKLVNILLFNFFTYKFLKIKIVYICVYWNKKCFYTVYQNNPPDCTQNDTKNNISIKK